MPSVTEKWKNVRGFEELYEVSNFGNVRSKRSGNLLVQQPNHKGYLRVLLCGKSRYQKRVHRLVAEAFIRLPFPNEEIDHLDGNKQNNHVSNLQWVTGTENIRRFYKDRYATEEIVRVAMALVAGGWSIQKAADRVGRNKHWLKDICRGKTWKHLNLNGCRRQ